MATTGRDVGMYRLSLALLWAGVALFAVLAVIDAMVDFMGHLQGLFLAGGAACFVGAILHTGLHRLNETAIANRRRSEQIQEDVEEKTKQVRGDVDQVRCQVDGITDKVNEVRDWAEASVLMDPDKKTAALAAEPEQEPCPIYQLRIRDGHREAIVGKRTPDPIDPAEVWPLFRDGETGTLPGTSAS